MAQLLALGASLLCAMLAVVGVSAQDADRMWGRVLTSEGHVLEGFLRWDRNEGGWVDVLDGIKEVPEENYLAWLAANDEERAQRVIELLGHRISWEEEHPDFARRVTSGVRFGHLAWIRITGSDEAELGLRSGQTVRFEGGSTDIGGSLRRLGVQPPGSPEVRLRWRELDRIDFSAVPPGAIAASRRLYGTVEDERGRSFTGYVAWDLDEILEADVLDGEELRGGREHEIPFADISSIERLPRGSRVTLRDGRILELTGTNDVDDDNRGVQVSDPHLGLVDVAWEAFRTVRFHRPDGTVGYADFDGGHELQGAVTTRSGEELLGFIRWDADESASWELLNGRSEGVAFSIELSEVSRIVRGEAFGATVTLVDGRAFDLDEANDVDWDNKGIMVAPDGADRSDASAWRVVAWDDFDEVRFR